MILALIEGVAEILPVDATGHALLLSWLVHWRAGTIAVAIHFGAALALVAYLWREVGLIGQGLWKLRLGRVEPGSRLLGKVALAAGPWIAAGFVVDLPQPQFRDLAWVGGLTILSAVVMGLADRLCMTVKRIEHLSPMGTLLLGLVQMLALVPGVGRVAAAVTMGRVLGIERPSAYRFILLASIPVLLAAGGRDGVAYLTQGITPGGSDFVAGLTSFALVLVTVIASMAWVRRHGLLPFTLYRLAIGAIMVGLSFL